MADQILIGNFPKGLTLDRLPFVIDNDSFPTLYNFYVWRGRAKRKRGTKLLARLQLQKSIAASPLPWQLAQFALVAGVGNLISQYSLGSRASLVPGSLSLVVGANTYTDPAKDGILVGAPGGSGKVNYNSGEITISGGGVSNVTGTFSYYPGLPVMGLRDCLVPPPATFPSLLAFDTTYAYQIQQTATQTYFYNVSYYKNTNNPVVWSGANYQQFWTTNAQNAFWATNNKSGFHFVSASYTAGSGTATITMNLTKTGNFTRLINGDKLWFNEWGGGSTINGLVGTVTDAMGSAGGNYVITFTSAQTVAGTGIAQLLTCSISGEDGIRWYDGDPTSGTGIPTTNSVGWVNFAPPLTATTVVINNVTPTGLYYLVGAKMIVQFQDRLLFLSPYIQTSSGSATQLTDTILWSWNGTAYYANAPANTSSDTTAYYVDEPGKGGYLPAKIQQQIVTLSNNEDVLLIGFTNRATRFVYSGNDLDPFRLYTINSELGDSATFSGVTLDKGAVTIGTYGIALTSQTNKQRIDLQIPDTIFGIQALNNGTLRVNSIRDFYREWMYFCYPVAGSDISFPTQTLLYNYRDDTWAIFYENFTTHGSYRQPIDYTWQTIPYDTWAEWAEPWNSAYMTSEFPAIVAGNPQGFVLIKDQGTGEGKSGYIKTIAASGTNTQITSIDHCVQVGDYEYISDVTGLLTSTITAISKASQAVITTVNTFSIGQYVTISGVNGMTQLNGNTYKIVNASGASITIDVNSTNFSTYTSGGTVASAFNGLIGRVVSIVNSDNFVIDLPTPVFGADGYIGKGAFTRLSQPFLQTKQFNPYWNEGRQVRLSTQKYLLDYTSASQATVQIFLSQDPDDIWNAGSIVPTTDPTPQSDSLIYSDILYTCPESTNIGLTPANTNLQMLTAQGQYQIWHRQNTSLQGDTFQIGITLSDAQMRNLTYATSELTVHAMQFNISKGPLLA